MKIIFEIFLRLIYLYINFKRRRLSAESISPKNKKEKTEISESDTDSIISPINRKKKNAKKVISDIETIESESESESESDDDDDDDDDSENEDGTKKGKTRQKIRKVIDEKKLDKTTLDAVAAENERKKRIEERKLALVSESNNNNDIETIEVIKKQVKELYLDITKDGKKRVKVDQSIADRLKAHQIEGIQFMWDSMYESIEMIAEGHKGSGCLLAHCMGLGKTFQTVALIHTLFKNQTQTKVHKVLILMPINVLINWKNEFKKWTTNCATKLNVYDLSNLTTGLDATKQRVNTLEKWFNNGGIFLMGYTMFTRLVQGTNIKSKALKDRINKCLTKPGADLIVCDEGHIMKSEKTAVAKSIYQVNTLRRVVLTGTPLQNNLIEYHCMVSFVKPSLLGTKKEFMNRFVNPINNGSHKDSTDSDVRFMKKRAHVLHNTLDGSVQRKDYDIIRNLLPSKNEYVILIRLSDKQIDLYRKYLEEIRGIHNDKKLGKVAGAQLFSDFQTLSRIVTHPWVLKVNQDRLTLVETKQNEMKEFLDDEEDIGSQSSVSSDTSNLNSLNINELNDVLSDEEVVTKKKKKVKLVRDSEDSDASEITIQSSNSNSDAEEEVVVVKATQRTTTRSKRLLNSIVSEEESDNDIKQTFWWTDMVDDSCESDISLSGKLVIFDMILKMCDEIGDKLIVFSQSLLSLNMIEKFLQIIHSRDQNWRKDRDYFRIDGTTDLGKRSRDCKVFNDGTNHRARLYLISTKAGGIGINLVGANRCIVFDASWNPSYDTQSIFRIYRFGQTKSVFIYRFLSQGTMEEKIYQRQVNKQSLAQRVVDEHQLDNHFTSNELKELYRFEPNIYDPEVVEYPVMPVDEILKSLLLDAKRWIFSYHEHDSLLENKISEGLSEEDRQAAWQEYEAEKSRPTMAQTMGQIMSEDDTIKRYKQIIEWQNQQRMELDQQQINNLNNMNQAIAMQRQVNIKPMPNQ